MCLSLFSFAIYVKGEQGWRSGESAPLPPMCPGFDSQTRRHMWVEFLVGSLPCSERFFSGYSGFLLSSKTNISKFQFYLDYSQALYLETLARVFAQALRVFDIKFTFTFAGPLSFSSFFPSFFLCFFVFCCCCCCCCCCLFVCLFVCLVFC